MPGLKHPVTPDGRYFVVRGKFWRLAKPGLSAAVRSTLVGELMAARSAVRSAKLSKDLTAEAAAHHAVRRRQTSSASAVPCGGRTARPI
jgi:hypothetical protein